MADLAPAAVSHRAAMDQAIAAMATGARRSMAHSVVNGARVMLANPAWMQAHTARVMPILVALDEDAQVARLRRAIADHRAALAAGRYWADRNHLVALRQLYVAIRVLRLWERAGAAALADAAE